MYRFNVDLLKKALRGTGLVVETYEEDPEIGVTYVYFVESNISYIRATTRYTGDTHCINIYHGESTKNGFWWDGELNYDELADELLKYV